MEVFLGKGLWVWVINFAVLGLNNLELGIGVYGLGVYRSYKT